MVNWGSLGGSLGGDLGGHLEVTWGVTWGLLGFYLASLGFQFCGIVFWVYHDNTQ